MERLTFEGKFCDIAQCRENPCPYNGSCSQREVWERLKEYEDKCESPEVLEKADKAGRVVVLPCKVGDTVYVSYGEGYRPCVVDHIHVLTNSEVQIRARYLVTETLLISASEFGQTVFLTREEAEEALEAMKNE